MRHWYAVLCGLLLLSGCGRPQAPTTPPAPTTPLATTTDEGLKLTLSLSGQSFQPDETVWAEVSVENTGRDTIPFLVGGCGPEVRIAVTVPQLIEHGPLEAIEPAHWEQLKEVLERSSAPRFRDEQALAGQTRACPAVISVDHLEPGERLPFKLGWKQGLDLYPEDRLAPAGRYRVKATFGRGTLQSEDPVSVEAEIDLQGERPALISAGKALNLALAHPPVRDWYQAHLGRALVRQEGDKWYVKDSADQWIAAAPTFAESVARSYPETMVVHQQGDWVATLVQKSGPPPHLVVVHLNAATGALGTVQFDQGK